MSDQIVYLSDATFEAECSASAGAGIGRLLGWSGAAHAR